MPDSGIEVIKILDTTVAESGPDQTIVNSLLRQNVPVRMHADIASGDVIRIYGRLSPAHSWALMHEFTDETPVDIDPSRLINAQRTTDGTVCDSKVYVMNQYTPEQVFTVHA